MFQDGPLKFDIQSHPALTAPTKQLLQGGTHNTLGVWTKTLKAIPHQQELDFMLFCDGSSVFQDYVLMRSVPTVVQFFADYGTPHPQQ